MPDSGTDRWTQPAVILVATDLNDLDRLMPFAFKQADETGARLILLHVLAAGTGMSVDAVGMPYYDPAEALEFAEKALHPWCEQASRRNIGCDALLREGNAAQQIAAVVRQFQADRVLLGTRSRSKLGKLLLGSVAEQVLRSVNLPVFTVGPEAHLAVAAAGQEQVVLYATTLREASRPSAALACRIASSQGAKLVLLHVLPPMEEMEKQGLATGQDSVALRELRILAAEASAGCCSKVEARVVHGNPTIEILSESSERHASLIVLGATQRSALENLTRDRTIYRVLAHARCPVLTLKEPLLQTNEAQTERMATHR
ncbi:MAG: universal stress protein [Terracidiphilus sp.]|nr:universal stress protein [Terracidiphilus sp.]